MGLQPRGGGDVLPRGLLLLPGTEGVHFQRERSGAAAVFQGAGNGVGTAALQQVAQFETAGDVLRLFIGQGRFVFIQIAHGVLLSGHFSIDP